jgi:sugar phosphate isomerase/epimerase
MGAYSLAVSCASFGHDLRLRRMTLEDTFRAAVELGLGSVEIDDAYLLTSPLVQRAADLLMRRYFGPQAFFRAYTTSRLLHLHTAFEDACLRLAAWRAHTDFTLADRAARWQMNYLEGAIAAANDFGARIVCIQSGGTNTPDEEEQARCVEGLQKAASLARRFRTRLALESGNGLARRREYVERLVAAVNSPYLGAVLEFDQGEPGAAGRAIHVRARACAFDVQGRETTIDYPAHMEALRQAGYKGWVAIDYEGDGDPGYGIMQTAELISAVG